MSPRRVVLASSSRYRAELLRRLVPGFEQLAPSVDERALGNESAAMQVERLSRAKARAVATARPDALVVASDQLAQTERGDRLGKPGDAHGAALQLRQISGTEVAFLTGVCVLDARTSNESYRLVETRVRLRELSADAIETYVSRDEPFDCAGSFKAERLGIALFEWVRSDDPTALVGLPLIATAALLRAAGLDVLGGDQPDAKASRSG